MSPRERARLQRKHIFAVNGSPEFLDLIRELMQGEDYNVTTTNFAPSTFDQIATLHPSLLIVDLVVGDRSGWELLEKLVNDASTSGIPVIVFSTSSAVLDTAQAHPFRYGGQRFIEKPFDLEDLLQSVAELIGPA